MKTGEDADKNIDAFHIHKAYHCIETWFNNPDRSKDRFRKKFISDTAVIWYDVSAEENGNSKTTVIDIFTRLNVGKIPLTNAELIKALFLRRGIANEAIQNQIAIEWDIIQKNG